MPFGDVATCNWRGHTARKGHKTTAAEKEAVRKLLSQKAGRELPKKAPAGCWVRFSASKHHSGAWDTSWEMFNEQGECVDSGVRGVFSDAQVQAVVAK
jgi:hypothetical protein